MPIKDLEAYCKRHAVKCGKYYVRHYENGGFFLYKTGWKRGIDVPSDERLVQRYNEQLRQGRIKESLKGQIAARAVLACGYLSRDVGREILNLPKGNNHGSKKEAKKAVHDYWRPRRSESGFFRPTRNTDKRVTDFMQGHNRAYKYMARNMGGFKKAIDSWYQGCYREVSLRRTQESPYLSENEIINIFIDRFNSGLAVSACSLKHSVDPQERELYRRVLDLAEKDIFGKKRAYTEIAHSVTGIPLHSIILNKGAHKNCAELTENFTEFLFYWSSLLGLETWNFDNTQWTEHKGNAINLLHGDKRYMADLRIGNKAIEVKTGIARFSENRRDEIIEKYGNRGVWETGGEVEKGAVIFHARPSLYSHFLPAVKQAGLQAISYEDFHSHLTALIEQMKTKSPMYRDVRPITSLDYLLDLHEEVSLHPFLLVRTENNARRQWGTHILRALIERAQELRDTKFKRAGS